MKKPSLPRENKVCKGPEFKLIYKKGRRAVSRYFVWFYLRETGLYPLARFGVTVTKDIGSAVCRNRIKRQVREAFRLNKDTMPPGRLVIKARLAAGGAKSALLRSDLEDGLIRINKGIKRKG